MSRYIRFRVQRKDERSGSPEGLFTVAYREAEDRTLYDYEREWLHDLLRWFTKNLETPEVLRVRKNNGAVCWFIDAPSGVMDKARELITFLETRGYLIELDHTTRPGSI